MPNIIEMEGRFLFQHGDDLYFVAKTIDRRLSPKFLKHVARWLPNSPIWWRHQTPQKEKFKHQPMFGRVIASKAVPPMGVVSIVKLFGKSNVPWVYAKRNALQTLVRKSLDEKVTIGLSLTYDTLNVNNSMDEAEPIETSVTPWPACVTCTLKSGWNKMTPDNEEIKEETSEEEDVQEDTEIEEESDANLDDKVKEKIDEELEKATIEELQSLLDSKIVENEELKKQHDEELKSKTKETQTLEDRVKELEEKQDKLLKELEDSRRAPHVERLKKADKRGLFSDALISAMKIKELEATAAKLEEGNKVDSKISVTSMAESAKKVQENEEEDEPKKKLEEMSLEELEKAIDTSTELGKKLKKALLEKEK